MEKPYGQNLNEQNPYKQNIICLITCCLNKEIKAQNMITGFFLTNKFQILTIYKRRGRYLSKYKYIVHPSFKLLPAELVDNQGGSKAGEEEDRPHHHAADVGLKLCA